MRKPEPVDETVSDRTLRGRDADLDPQAHFYLATVLRLLDEKILHPDDRILVVCGGGMDRDVLHAAGLTNVVISNIDERMEDNPETLDDYAPFEWAYQNVEHLTEGDDTFDFCLVHSGLHHCYSPHRGIAEMNRVARRGMILFEPRDSWFTRLGVRLGFGQEYEHAAVFSNDMRYGGVANTEIPNYVYRFSENEIRKTILCLNPHGVPLIRFFHALRISKRTERLKNPIWRLSLRATEPFLTHLARAFPVFSNNFACLVLKPVMPDDIRPWLLWKDGQAVINEEWMNERYRVIDP